MQNRCISSDILVSRDRYVDIDLQAARLSGHDQLYRQLSGGKFEGSFASIEDSQGSGIFIERVNQVIEQAAAVPMGQVSILFLTGGQQMVRFGGSPYSLNQVTIAGPGKVLDFQSAKDTEVCVLSLTSADFEALSEGTRYQQIGRSGIETYDNPLATAGLRRRIARITKAAFQDEEPANRLPSLSSLIGDLLEGLLGDSGNRVGADAATRRARRTDIFRAARSMILESLDQISVPILSRQLHVSRRTLEYAFQEMVGLSPMSYITRMRLNAIRRDILRTDESIGDIAARYGVWHMSRFAANYRAAFGQLPSATRRSN